jgi:hypothetical protein
MAVPGNSAESLIPQDSLSESKRFGLAVARLTVDHPEGFDIGRLAPSLVGSGADVVIVRYPNPRLNSFHNCSNSRITSPSLRIASCTGTES